MNPYYKDESVVILHGDCREIVPQLGKFDLTLTDAPYNGNLKYGPGTNDNREWDEYAEWLNNIIIKCEAQTHGPVICFVSKPGLIKMCQKREPWWIGQWHGCNANPAGPNNGIMFSPNYEPCLFYGNRYYFKAYIPDSWTVPVNTERNGHPCPKPLRLMSRILTLLPAQTILDPFMGSGTTLRAAKDLGRKAVGIELEEKYCEIAANRMGQEVLPFNQLLAVKG